MYGPLTQLGRYEILGKIAAGGMATVYRAKMDGPQGFSKVVALKLMHPHLAEDEHHVTMFMDEGRLSARFTHPNLVSVFDYGELDAYRFMAMEYHPGLTLSRLWRLLRKKKEPLSLALTLHIMRETLHGLDYAHNLCDEDGAALEIIHRDVSPENILLTTQGSVKVLDFGIALDNARRAVSRTGIVKGKISYMSPEQVSGRTLDRRSDIYATAVMAYELITGQYLFGEGSTEEIRRRIMNAHKVPIKKGSIPNSAVEEMLIQALSHDPDSRFRTAGSFRDSIDKVLQEEGWQTDPAALAELIKESIDEIEKEEAAKRRKAAAQERAKAKKLEAKQTSTGGFGITWFARASVALLLLSLVFELFGVEVSLTAAESHATTPEQNTSFQEELESESPGSPIQPTITQDTNSGNGS